MSRRRRVDFGVGLLLTPEEQPDLTGTATSTTPTNYSVSNSILNTALNTVKVQGDVTSSALVDYTVFA